MGRSAGPSNFTYRSQHALMRARDPSCMATASVQPVFKSAAHRRVVMQHIGATIVPSAISHVIVAPLAGLALICGSTFVALTCNAITSAGEAGPAMVEATWNALSAAYIATAFAAAISGVWVALLSPFVPESSPFYAGAAAIGMVNAVLFASAPESAGLFNGQLFLAVVGGVTGFLCAWLFRDNILHREDMRRDTLSRDRADRLAKQRNGS